MSTAPDTSPEDLLSNHTVINFEPKPNGDAATEPDAPPQEVADAEERRSQADQLIALARSAELFHASDDTCFADVQINGHRETWPIRSQGFRRWLMRRFYEVTGKAPRGEAMSTATQMIEALARYEGQSREVFVRVGRDAGRIYVDLCDDTWRAVEINPGYWRVIDAPPVRFRRSKGMTPLPVPERGGSVNLLRKYMNVANESDFVLIVAWLIASLQAPGPYPVLVITGEQGSAKSTSAALLRSLVDPNCAPLRALPREERDLFIAATNGYLLCFDNMSGLPHWLSDAMCRLATGGGYAARTLFTDADETLIDVMRPALMNGIEEVISRADLADRSLAITLEAIPEERRRTEADIKEAFAIDRPKILGALFDALARALRNLPTVKLDRLPRMADFAKLIVAAETAMWPKGTFMAAYEYNRASAVDTVIEADAVADTVRRLVTAKRDWRGTAGELLSDLTPMAELSVVRSKAWPQTPRALGGRLRRAATFLRRAGVEVEVDRREGRSGSRLIRLWLHSASQVGARPSEASAPSAAPVSPEKQAAFADGRGHGRPSATVSAEALPSAEFGSNLPSSDGPDDTDGQIPTSDAEGQA